jgi:hypothetical protein
MINGLRSRSPHGETRYEWLPEVVGATPGGRTGAAP